MRKRFFLFVLLFLTTFLMNLFLWNENYSADTTNTYIGFFEGKNSTDDVYELHYQPSADENNVIQTYSKVNRIVFYSF